MFWHLIKLKILYSLKLIYLLIYICFIVTNSMSELIPKHKLDALKKEILHKIL